LHVTHKLYNVIAWIILEDFLPVDVEAEGVALLAVGVVEAGE
jgi:hypothetical protein